jgi:hypothetical protein
MKYLDAKYINFIKIELIKINKPEKPNEKLRFSLATLGKKSKIFFPNEPREKIIPSMKKYFENKEKFLQEKQKFKNNLLNWRIRILYMTQKLVDLVNNQDSRQSIINYIKNINPENIIIKLLESNYKLSANVMISQSEIINIANNLIAMIDKNL